ncbi:hypothetical protein SCLCIDRAFT_476148 [Scleroderma citrinum Foug A]|uniref:Uncharacterized protein n=1 Tax=Scleroderma citrinum Foug A TaxID=1036808 RepID=A0A0C2YTL1_9AGAM|nr:hypothetical protein SCLCIDRAFT_476148 [Scleroderma citrinum Foug A]
MPSHVRLSQVEVKITNLLNGGIRGCMSYETRVLVPQHDQTAACGPQGCRARRNDCNKSTRRRHEPNAPSRVVSEATCRRLLYLFVICIYNLGEVGLSVGASLVLRMELHEHCRSKRIMPGFNNATVEIGWTLRLEYVMKRMFFLPRVVVFLKCHVASPKMPRYFVPLIHLPVDASVLRGWERTALATLDGESQRRRREKPQRRQ